MQGFPLPSATMAEASLWVDQVQRLEALIERHVQEGRYPGCQIAIARQGRIVVERTFGQASLDASDEAHADTLWLLYSNTKVITAAALWVLAERGAFRFADRVSDHVPAFAANGKRDVTVADLLTHRAGFPSAAVPPAAWTDHDLLRATVSDFALEFAPGSRMVYHPASAHWTAAVLMEVLTGQDYRDVIRTLVIEPLGLADEMFVGLPDHEHFRAADMHEPDASGVPHALAVNNTAEWRRAGAPGGGGYATARAMTALYQMMLNGGALGPGRVMSPRTLQHALRDWTGTMIDGMNGLAMHRALGPHLRGTEEGLRGLGSLASSRTFGHGGVGSSYCWGDPDSGVSFAYLSNCKVPDPWHTQRMDAVSNMVHAAIL